MPTLKGIIFDLDGTLTLTQQYHFMAYAEVFKKHGVIYTESEDLQKYAGKGSKYTFPEVFAAHGRQVTEAELNTCMDEKKQIYDKILASVEIQTVPGIKDFLKKMKELGIKMIVATGNHYEAAELILERTGIRNYFEDLLTSKDVPKPKPAPDIFLLAAKKIGFKPEECIVFEDAINGIIAAKAGGIRSIGVETFLRSEELKNAGASFTIKNYNELTDHMLGIEPAKILKI